MISTPDWIHESFIHFWGLGRQKCSLRLISRDSSGEHFILVDSDWIALFTSGLKWNSFKSIWDSSLEDDSEDKLPLNDSGKSRVPHSFSQSTFWLFTQVSPLPEPKSLSPTSEELEDRMRFAESFRSFQGHLSSFFWTVVLSHWPNRDWRSSSTPRQSHLWKVFLKADLCEVIHTDLEFLWFPF